MLKLNSQSASAAQAQKLPPGTLLGVSWLNGRFSAIALHKGALGVAWSSPTPVTTPADFLSALREAVKRTAFQGTNVALVLLHPQFHQHWVDVPTGKAGALSKYLQRQVQQHKPFSGAASWAFQLTVPTKASGGALLHLMPTELYEGIVEACNDAGLHLGTLTPGSEVLRSQLRQLPLRDDEITLVAAAHGETTTVLVARGDTMPLLVRTLPGSWNHEAARVAVDLNRTLLFAQQQYGVVVSNAWLADADATERVPGLVNFLEVPLKASPAPAGEFSWAEEALRLSVGPQVNLISREHREAPARRTVMRFSTYSAIGLLSVACGLTALVQYHHREEKRAIGRLKTLEQELQGKHRSLQEFFVETERKSSFLSAAPSDQPDPIPTWVLGGVTEALPRDLVLTNLTLLAETNQWRVTLSGAVQPTSETTPVADVSRLTREFALRLNEGPLGLTFDPLTLRDPSTNAPVAADAKGGVESGSLNAWTSRLREFAHLQPSRAREFLLQGVLR